jgi:hypothetical protein
MATELLINIVSQATGKGFLESEKSVKKLQKNVKTLGKTFGVTFAVGAVVAFGKAAVKAFSEDEKAANRLSRAVENLGIGFANPAISKFIADLEKTSAIADDVLRPAFQNLLTTTGSLTKSQELLNNAITISRASGVDLATVANDLAKAYVGSNKGLAKYSTGLTRAEIESKSFSEVLGVLLKQSAGAAEDYLSSTAYQMEVLSIAGGNASEIIGGGLVDAFAMIAGGTEASDAAKGIEIVATGVANLARATGAAVTGIPTLLRALKNLPKNIFGGFAGVSAGININTPTETNKLTASQKKQKEAMAKLEKAALARAKQLADLAKKQANAEKEKTKQKEIQAKLDKAALALGKGEDVFDLDKIQIQAAILAKQDEINKLGTAATDQQKLQLANDAQRLTVKQLMLDLEDAIADKDVERATSLSKQLNTELAILGTLTGQTYKLSEIDKILERFKPKDLINLDNLDAAIRKLLEIAGSRFDFLSPIMPSQDRTGINELAPDIAGRYVAGDPEAIRAVEAHADAISMLAESELALADALLAESIRALDLATASVSPNALPNFGGFDPARFRMADNITVNVNAGVVGSEDTISLAVQRAILDLERKGDPLRYTGGL